MAMVESPSLFVFYIEPNRDGLSTIAIGEGDHSAPDITRIQAACHPSVGCALDDGPPVGKQGHLIGLAPELQHKFIVPHHAERLQPTLHLGKINRPGALVN